MTPRSVAWFEFQLIRMDVWDTEMDVLDINTKTGISGTGMDVSDAKADAWNLEMSVSDTKADILDTKRGVRGT